MVIVGKVYTLAEKHVSAFIFSRHSIVIAIMTLRCLFDPSRPLPKNEKLFMTALVPT
jgi:hypothetical protein